jgi:hypothetical protein
MVALGALLLGCSEPAHEGPAPAHDAQRLNRSCASCHVEIAGEWARSEHHRSADAVFRAALRREPSRFCESCHAPEAPTSHAAAGALGELGVACVTCHDPRDEAARVPEATLPARHPPVARSSGVAACKSCHEFEFPGERQQRELFQATVTEQERSSYAGAGCSGCHMPRVVGRGPPHASHAFAASRSAQAQRDAVRLVAERTSATSLRLTLASRGVGHAYPTGDLFRRLAIRVEARAADFAVLARSERFLARHFSDVRTAPRTTERRVELDDRLWPGETRVVELELGAEAAGHELHYELRLERVLHMNPRFEAAAQVASDELVASGFVPALPEKSP